jgi:hypothetical protein
MRGMEILKEGETYGNKQGAFRALKAAGGRFYKVANSS